MTKVCVFPCLCPEFLTCSRFGRFAEQNMGNVRRTSTEEERLHHGAADVLDVCLGALGRSRSGGLSGLVKLFSLKGKK